VRDIEVDGTATLGSRLSAAGLRLVPWLLQASARGNDELVALVGVGPRMLGVASLQHLRLIHATSLYYYYDTISYY